MLQRPEEAISDPPDPSDFGLEWHDVWRIENNSPDESLVAITSIISYLIVFFSQIFYWGFAEEMNHILIVTAFFVLMPPYHLLVIRPLFRVAEAVKRRIYNKYLRYELYLSARSEWEKRQVMRVPLPR